MRNETVSTTLKYAHTVGTYFMHLENIVLYGRTDDVDNQYHDINKELKHAAGGHIGTEEHLSFQVIKLLQHGVPGELRGMFDQV